MTMSKGEMKYIEGIMILCRGGSRYNIQSNLRSFDKVVKKYGRSGEIGYIITSFNIDRTIKDIVSEIKHNEIISCSDCDKQIVRNKAHDHYGSLICSECFEREQLLEDEEIRNRWNEEI